MTQTQCMYGANIFFKMNHYKMQNVITRCKLDIKLIMLQCKKLHKADGISITCWCTLIWMTQPWCNANENFNTPIMLWKQFFLEKNTLACDANHDATIITFLPSLVISFQFFINFSLVGFSLSSLLHQH